MPYGNSPGKIHNLLYCFRFLMNLVISYCLDPQKIWVFIIQMLRMETLTLFFPSVPDRSASQVADIAYPLRRVKKQQSPVIHRGKAVRASHGVAHLAPYQHRGVEKGGSGGPISLPKGAYRSGCLNRPACYRRNMFSM